VTADAAWPWLSAAVIVYVLLFGLWDVFQAGPRRLALKATLLQNWREDERAPHFRGVFVAACLASGVAPPFTWLTFLLMSAARVVVTGAAAFCAVVLGQSVVRAALLAAAAYFAAGALMLVEDRRERGPGTPFPVPPNLPLTVAARFLFWPVVKALRVRSAAPRKSAGPGDAGRSDTPELPGGEGG
jgi:hypothetical protein